MPFLEFEILKKLYSSGLSISNIALQQKVSVHKVVYWMGKYKIPRRSRSDATYVQMNPLGDPFRINAIDSLEKTELFALGIGLFLGEGNKKDKFHVRFTNSDPRIIRIFLNFIRRICGVEEQKIKAFVNFFDDRLYQDCLDYWVKVTGISQAGFYKPTIRPRKIGTYKNKSKYGTITINVNNKKLLDQIKLWCNDYVNKFAEVAQW